MGLKRIGMASWKAFGGSGWPVLAVLAVFLVLISGRNYLLFHTLAEAFSIVIALLLWVVAWQTYPYSRNGFLMYLANGYLWVGLLDAAHTLSYEGMALMEVSGAPVTTKFWVATRVLEATVLLSAPLFIGREVRRVASMAGFGVASIALYAVIEFGWFPETFIPGVGLTPFKVYSEYAVIALLAAALALLWRRRSALAPETVGLMAVAMVLTMVAEMAFTFYIDVTGPANLVGHVFKLFSYWLIFVAVVSKSLREPYDELRAENRLRAEAERTTRDLADSLEARIDERAAELRRSEASLARAQAIAHVGSWDWDVKAGSLAWSREIYRIFGLPEEGFEATYEAFLERVHPEDRDAVRRGVEDALAKRRPYALDHRIVRPDGEVRVVHEQAQVRFAEDGEPVEMNGTVQDVTDTRAAEARLRETEALNRALLDATTAAVFLIDREGTMLATNPVLPSRLGLSVEAVLGRSMYDLIPPEVAEGRRKQVAKAIRTNKPVRFEDWRDGRLIDQVIYPVAGDDGQVAQLAIYAEDITERRRVEREHDNLFQLSGDLLCIAGIDGYFKRVNPSWKKILGWTDSELRGTPFMGFVHPDDVKTTLQAMGDLKRGLPVAQFRNRYRRADGDYLWLEWNSTPDEDGDTIYAVARDVTERTRIEQALRDSETKLQQLLAHIPQGVFYKDSDGVYLAVNPTYAGEFDTTPEAFIGKTDFDFHPKDLAEKYIADDKRIMEAGEPEILEEQYRARDGRMVDVHTSKVPVRGGDGSVIGILGVFWDITDRKRAEREVAEKSVALEASNAELQQFAYAVSHDLQEPLRMVSSYVQLLARRYEGKLGEDADEFIAFTLDGTQRMQAMIRDLLEYSRVQTRGKPFEPIDSGRSVAKALANLKMAVDDADAEVAVAALPTVMADPGQLMRVFQNLIGNAIKYRAEDRPPKIAISAERDTDGQWRFDVADNGIGIEEKDFERLFGVFQRLHTRDKYPGTGVGLSLCKRIVERHGGRIWLDSTPGEGSTFHFTFPAAPEETDAGQTDDAPPTD